MAQPNIIEAITAASASRELIKTSYSIAPAAESKKPRRSATSLTCVNLAPFSDKEVPRYRYSQYDQRHVLLAAGVPVVQATCEPRSQIRMDWWWRIRGPSKRLRLRGKQGESSHNALRTRSLFGYSSASARSAALPQSTPTEHPIQYDTPATIKKTCPPAIARVGFRTCWISRQKCHQAEPATLTRNQRFLGKTRQISQGGNMLRMRGKRGGSQEVSVEASRRSIHSSQASASEGDEGFQSLTTSKT